MTILSANNLGKAYRSYSSEWQRFARWFGIKTSANSEQWIIRDINFDIQAGESIGIIGQNGAGKSTLLKMISRTLKPTEGKVQVNGRIAAILELGMGFNHDLTGRQNAIHATGLMGFNAEQIDAVIPSIEAFAEIGEYFDEPIRTYSSGMQMRVAFAVVTAYRPDILIVDEALSVGDAYFQHKSFARIRELQEQGTTLLIVSHDSGSIQTLCDRAILLDSGQIIKDAKPEEVFDFYNALIAEKDNSKLQVEHLDNGKAQTSSGTGEATIENISLYNSKDEEVETIAVGENIVLRIAVKVHKKIESLVLGYSIKDRLGRVMYGTNTWHSEQIITNPKKGGKYLFEVKFPANLGVGSYSIQVALVDSDTHLTANYDWRDLALMFNVINLDKTYFTGCLWNEPEIQIKELV